ncbi:hypothetical protein CC2G_009932 [Coprinopsis cinerea AmutBmut pab1-1]|nr:hypothetical protein CC2G_009932 [Coprinopsis cinerea AmutBmut pab1-1]
MTVPAPMVPESMALAGLAATDDPNARRALIDSRIAALEDEIRRWKSSRNELSEISRLPPEVLTRIFVIYEEMCNPDSVDHTTWRPVILKPYQWTDVTHVSRYWREAALGCPELWSNIRTSNCNWAMALLERSKQAPISLDAMQAHGSKLEALLTDVLAQPQRLKSLRLSGHSFIEKRLGEMTSPAPLLQCLTMRRGYVSYSSSEILPTTFLGGEAPQLQSLELNGYFLPWDSTLLRGLTSLKLNFTPSRNLPRPSPEAFFGALEAMESLRTLHLDTLLPASPLENRRTITLRHMEEFRLNGPMADCANIMTHVVLPPSAILHFVVSKKPDESVQSMTDLSTSITASWLSGPLSNSSIATPNVINTVELDFGYNTFSFRGYPRDAERRLSGSCRGTRNQASLTLQAARESISHLLAGLPLNNVRTVALTGGIDDSALVFLGRLPCLHTLSVDHDTSEGFFRYIAADPALRPMVIKKGKATTGSRKPKPQPTQLSYFSALKKLILSGVDFRYTFTVDAFLDFLMMRYELGGEIVTLELTGCIGLYPGHVKQLREVVVDVEWDGKTIHYYSDEEDDDDDGCEYCGRDGCEYCDDDLYDYEPTIEDLLSEGYW